MNFKQYLLEHINKHSAVQPQDIVKLCYQAAYGAEHLLSDPDVAEKYLERDYAATEAADIALYENISDDVCRVNLAAWKFKKLPLQWLFRMFAASARIKSSGSDLFSEYLRTAECALMETNIGFSPADWKEYLAGYKKAGMTSVHHSPQYRECERPSYRIVDRQYIRLLPILERVSNELREDRVCVIAIDGRAASGKSTMAKQLKTILGADIIQMDDFFLPTELRTQERLSTPGGNIHYERFSEEVLPYISLPQCFSYRIFDCGKMDYNGERAVDNTQIRIVEGAYSCHPLFGKYADIAVFSDVEPGEQMRRIYDRNGEMMAKMFREKWIPLEENYFDHYKISQNSLYFASEGLGRVYFR